jgi:hypothetical protein
MAFPEGTAVIQLLKQGGPRDQAGSVSTVLHNVLQCLLQGEDSLLGQLSMERCSIRWFGQGLRANPIHALEPGVRVGCWEAEIRIVRDDCPASGK